jgi:hypothetical protein
MVHDASIVVLDVGAGDRTRCFGFARADAERRNNVATRPEDTFAARPPSLTHCNID